MGRQVNQSAFHIHLMKSIHDLLEMSRKYREATDPEEKKKFSRRFTDLADAVDVCLGKYKVDKLKFIMVDINGKRTNAR